jgi:mRNA interferase MazF
MADFPKRGEVWLVNWNPARGSEQAGMRPAVVVQNNIGNEKAPTTIVAAVSSSVRVFPMNVRVDPPEGGLRQASIVKTSQLLTVAKNRLERKLGKLNKETMDKVNKAIVLSLGLG